MARVSRARVANAFRAGDAATTVAERGRALEDLLVHLFCDFVFLNGAF